MARKGKINPPSDFAQVFSQSLTYNKAFTPREVDPVDEESESDAMLNHYLDEEEK